MNSSKYVEICPKTLIILPLVVGVIVSLFIFGILRSKDSQDVRFKFQKDGNRIVANLKQSIDTHIMVLEALVGFQESSEEVTFNEFQLFVNKLIVGHPGFKRMQWMPRVAGSEKERFEAEASQQFPGFQIKQTNGAGDFITSENRLEHFPIYYVTPFEKNRAYLGLDFAASEKSAAPMERAATTQLVTVILNENKTDKDSSKGVSFLVPAYVTKHGANIGLSNKVLAGYFLAEFEIDHSVENVLGNYAEDLDMHVFNGILPSKDDLIFSTKMSESITSENPGFIYHDHVINVHGQPWFIRFTPTANFLENNRSFLPWIGLFSGLLFTGIMTLYLRAAQESVINERKFSKEQVRARQALEEQIKIKEKTEESLRILSKQHSALLDNIPDLAWLKDMKGYFVAVNEAFAKFHGMSKDGIIGRRDIEIRPAHLNNTKMVYDAEAIELRQTVRYEEKIEQPGSEDVWMETVKTPIVGDDNTVIGVVGISRDVTSRKQSELEMRQALANLNALLNALPDMVYFKDPQHRINLVNETFERRFGLLQADVLGKTAREVLPQGLVGISFQTDMELGSSDAQLKFVHSLPQANERTIHYETIKFPVVDNEGNLLGYGGVTRDITEQINYEDQLRDSETRYRAIFDTAAVGIHVSDMSGRVLQANQALMRMFGYSEEELHMKSFLELTDYNDIRPSLYFFKGLLDGTRNSYTYEKRFRRKNGSTFWASVSVSVMKDKDDIPQVVLAVIVDISGRKETEERLQWEIEVKSAIAELYVPLLSTPIDLNEITAKVLELALRLTKSTYGYIAQFDNKAQQLIIVSQKLSQDLVEHLQPIALDSNSHGCKTVWGHDIDPGKPRIENLYDPPAQAGSDEQSERIHNYLSAPVVLNDQFVGQIVLANRNLDYGESHLEIVSRLNDYYAMALNKRNLEYELKESELRFRTLAQGAFEGIVLSRDGIVIDVNRQFLDFIGYSMAEVQNRQILDFVAPQFREIAKFHITTRSEQVYESAFVNKAGELISVEVQGKLIPYGGTKVRIASVRDITQRKRTEQLLSRLATAVKQAAEAIVMTDAHGIVEFVNPAFERVSGYNFAEILGQNINMLKSGEHDRLFYRDLWDTIARGETWTGQMINKRKDGTLYHEESTISPVRDESGRIINYVAVKRDKTQEIDLQKQLMQAQKMEAIGTLAGGIAHDFNNVLQVVLGYSELIQSGGSIDSRTHEDLNRVIESAKNGADLVHRLLTFSRKTEIRPRPLNLNNQIVQLKKMLSRTLPKMIDISLVMAHDLKAVHADPAQIGQILMNLAVNARDAMPEGGILTIETKNVIVDSNYSKSHFGAKTGNYVSLTVSDSGHGMDNATVEHIFEPFFTTKAPGEGTGLGLAMVYGIVQQHGGFLTCESETDKGTRFEIFLPAISDATETREERDAARVMGGSETILLVDDDDLVRSLAERIISSAGYKIIPAGNGREALSLYTQHRDKVALVILDLIMPEMSGKQCLEELKKLNPEIKVIITSGYSHEQMGEGISEWGIYGFIHKPYVISTVLQEIRLALDGKRNCN